jgi:queuine/archaeosine tRNA-ribosyltransferase
MTDIEFFPAAIVGHFNKITSKPECPEYRFWGDRALFKYDKILYSFYYLQDRYNKLKLGESYFDSIGYTGKRMIDSGGFQVRTLGVDIKPQDVIALYKRERADVGMILDIPTSIDYDETKVEQTIVNTRYMVEHKNDIPNTEMLNVLHGFTKAIRRNYYEKVKEFNDKLDGWAVALIKRLSPIHNAWSFVFLYEKDKTLPNKRFHFLGLTGNKNLPIIYYIGKLGLVKSISFDSTKYGREGIMADMRNPAFLMERLSIGKMAKGKLKSNKFCPCPICQNISMERMIEDSNFVTLHNLFWEIKKMEFFDSFETAEDLKNYVLGSKEFPESTKIALKFIDYALKNGLDKAEDKFRAEFMWKNIPTKIQTLSELF